jgi:hypothetical protein
MTNPAQSEMVGPDIPQWKLNKPRSLPSIKRECGPKPERKLIG